MHTPSVVVGIDVSLVSTGLAQVSASGAVTGVVTSAGRRTDTLAQRVGRIRAIAEQVSGWLLPGALVVIEGPSYGSSGGSAWDRAGLWHRIVADAHLMGCPIAVVAPATRAKWATGSGRSDKAAVAVAAARLLPDVEFASSDESDAAVLGLMGAQKLDLRPQSQARLDALRSVAWPHEIDLVRAGAPAAA